MPRSKPPRNALRKLLAAAVGLMLLVTAAPHTAFAAYRNFPDVGPNDWYVVSGDFDYALDQGIFSGYENGNFGPAENVTRGMAATILWRIAGEPAAEAEPFLDVNYDAFYGDAITWARATGVISGYENGTFGPNGAVTREQLATMLANYASKIAKITITTDHTKLNAISGANQVSVWAYDALGWCVDNGILSGMNTAQGRQLQPQGTASRGQASKMFSVLHRDILDLGDSEGTGINVVDIPGVDVADYRDNAVLIDGAEAQVNQDSNQATVPADEADEVEAGDIVVVNPKDLENGIALKVTSVTKRGDDAVIKGTTPKPEEVFDKLEMEGETTITADDIELAQGVELVDGDVEQLASSEIDPQAIDGEVDFNTIKLKVEASKPLKDEFGNNVSLGGSITFKLRPVLSYSVDFNVFRLSKSYALVDLSLDPSVDISGDFDVEGKFKLFNAGSIAAFGVYFVVEADGSISLESDMPQLSISFGVGDCDRISEPKTDQTGTTWEMSGGISGKLGFLAEVSLNLLDSTFFDAGVELGGKGEYQETPRTPDFTCEDVNFWFYVSEHITGHALWTGSFEHSLFDKKNTPLKALNHYENGELVPKCTWDPNKPGDSDGDDSSTGDEDNPGSIEELPDATYSGEFAYLPYEDGITIVEYTGDDSSVVIPTTLDGKDVLSVDLPYFDPYEEGYHSHALETITNLSVAPGSKLVSIGIGYPHATEDQLVIENLDLRNANNLEQAFVIAANKLTSVNLSGLEHLSYFTINNFSMYNTNPSSLKEVILEDNYSLSDIMIHSYGTELQTIDVSEAPNLTTLDLYWCGLASLDLSSNTLLVTLGCNHNMLTELDLSSNLNLESVSCRDNMLTELDLSGNINLVSVDYKGNNLISLKLPPGFSE